MDKTVLIILAFAVMTTSAWFVPYHSAHRAPMRVTRYAPLPPSHRKPVKPAQLEEPQWERPKRHHDDYDHDYRGSSGFNGPVGSSGITGPIHTFVKTDKNANYKWGVRHHVGNKYAS